MTEVDIYMGFFNNMLLGLVLPTFVMLLLFKFATSVFKRGIRGY